MKNFLLCTLLILAALVGCKKQPKMGSNLLVITAVKGDFDTKATETAFEVNDKIGLYVNENVGNLPYETLDGVSWKCRGFLNEFLTGKDYYATAYYPYSESATNPAAIEVSSGIDFMIAEKTKLDIVNNAASGTLQFKHGLSKLLVTIDTPEEIDGIKTVSLDSVIVKNVFRKATINLATSVISGLTDKGDISSATNEIIVIPQTAPKIEFVFKMVGGGFSKLTYNTPLLLESGKKTTLNAHSNADLYFASYLNLMNGDAQKDLPLSIYVATGRKWTLKSSESWLTFSKASGVGKGLETITASVKVNSAYPLKPRAATLTLADDKPSKAIAKTMQNCTRIPTVEIAGTNWTMGNLTGTTQGQTSGFTVCTNPQDYSVFFKWGSKYAYNRESNALPSGHWGGSGIEMAATSPANTNTSGLGYDYAQGLAGGAAPGDPCQVLGSNYKTPTRAQWQALSNTGSKWGTYNNIAGRFFGANNASCNNTTLASGCIFLPAAGRRGYNDGLLYNETTGGYYWSSSGYSSTDGYFCNFYSGSVYPDYNNPRGYGFSVRCVTE